MPTRSNKHIKKYNQLVAVYEPADLEPMELVDSQREELLDRLSAIEDALDERIANDTGLDTADDLGF